MPAISVVMPAYNQEKYISHAIQSVLDQSFSDFELIIINDGSTDRTQEILETFKDARVKIVVQDNRGSIAARNAGLCLTTAPYITFLDADDMFLPNRLASMHAYLEDHPEVGLLAGGVRYIDSDGKTINEGTSKPAKIQLGGLLLENPIITSGVLLRRQWIERVGGFNSHRRFDEGEDWDLWLRMSKVGCQFDWLEQPVVAYRIHPEQMTRDPNRMRKGALELLDSFFCHNDLSPELLSLKDRAYAMVYIKSAARAFQVSLVETGKQDLAAALELDPSLKDNDFKELIAQLVGWAQSPQSGDPEVFLIKIKRNLPLSLIGMKPALHKAIATVVLEPVFKGTLQHQINLREVIVRAIYYDPSWLFNRGVLRQLIKGI